MQPRAAGIMFVHKGRVLLLKRAAAAKDAPSVWGLPGGHIEDGELPRDAARRETREETGYIADGVLHKLYDSRDGFRCFALRLDPDDDAFEPRLNHEHTDARWAPFDDLPQPLHPSLFEMASMAKTSKPHARDHLIKGKSDKARAANIATEVRAGKDPKQAAAIAYSVQRKAGGKDHALDAAGVSARIGAIRQFASDCMTVRPPKKETP